MRETKFRVWDREQKEYTDKEVLMDVSTGVLLVRTVIKGKQLLGFTSNYSIEQYTGLKDKNGVEIYEGDVVASFTVNGVLMEKGVVKWTKDYNIGCDGFEYNYSVYGLVVESEWLYSEMIYGQVEVIGNIHEVDKNER